MIMACFTYLKTRFACKKGQGMVEYGLIIGIIAVVIVLSLTALKQPIQTLFSNVVSIIQGNTPTDPTAAASGT